MTKFVDLDKKPKEKIENELEGKAAQMGLDYWEGAHIKSVLEDQIGLCSKCKSLWYCRTEFNNVFARCSTFEFNLSGQNRVAECNQFSPRGTLTLNDMFGIATIIDIPDKKMGF